MSKRSGIFKYIAAAMLMLFLIPVIPDPLSGLLVWGAADAYIEKNYSGEGFEIEDISYNFTYGVYSVHISETGSADRHFTAYFEKWGILWRDTYENDVISGQNTALRLGREYGEIVGNVFPERTFSDGGYLYVYGDIPYGRKDEIAPEEELDANISPDYSFVTEEAVADQTYDVKTFGAKHGKLEIKYENENISYGKASELLLWAKEEMDKAGIGFYAADLSLRVPPSGEYGERLPSDATIYILSFPYTEIYPEGLEDRIERAYKELYEYWDAPVTYLGEE